MSDNASTLWDQFVALLPQIVIALVILAAGLAFGRYARTYLRRALTKRYNMGFARVTSRMALWGFMLLVLLIAFAVVFPSVDMMSIIASLGFVSVAVGFALRDIIENAFAGLLLMYRESFVVGDQIEVVEIFGDVEEVNVRETVIRQRDGQRVIIPNRDVYKNNIRVQTAHKTRRYEFKLEFDYNVDHHQVIDTLVESMVGVEGVLDEPPPAGRIYDTDSEMVIVTLRGWTKSEQSHFNATRNRAIQKVIRTMMDEGIPLPDAVVPIEVEPAPTSTDATADGPATMTPATESSETKGSATKGSATKGSASKGSGTGDYGSGEVRAGGSRSGDSRSGDSRSGDSASSVSISTGASSQRGASTAEIAASAAAAATAALVGQQPAPSAGDFDEGDIDEAAGRDDADRRRGAGSTGQDVGQHAGSATEVTSGGRGSGQGSPPGDDRGPQTLSKRNRRSVGSDSGDDGAGDRGDRDRTTEIPARGQRDGTGDAASGSSGHPAAESVRDRRATSSAEGRRGGRSTSAGSRGGSRGASRLARRSASDPDVASGSDDATAELGRDRDLGGDGAFDREPAPQRSGSRRGVRRRRRADRRERESRLYDEDLRRRGHRRAQDWASEPPHTDGDRY